jgi:hypothetical protein
VSFQSRYTAAALTALVATIALSACSREEDVPVPTASPSSVRTVSPAPSPSPSPTRTTLSPAEQDAVDAEAAVVKYFQVLNRLSRNPKVRLDELTEVARGQAAA